jgi:hypothetical protein
MSRHIIDAKTKRSTSGMKLTMSRIPMDELPRRTTLALQRRTVSRSASTRAREYARIERGYTA